MDAHDLPPGPDRLLTLLDAGHLLRGSWTDGHERMCALSALSDEVRVEESADACPADLMPPWVAEMVPMLDDSISLDGWEARMRRLGESARCWPVLDDAAWERVRLAVLLCCLDIAEEPLTVDEWGVREALQGVREALQGRGSLEEAGAAAWAAARADGAAARAAARAAAWVAEAAARAAEAHGAAASAAAEAARAARATAAAAWAAAEAATWDRICDALLDAIDAEVASA